GLSRRHYAGLVIHGGTCRTDTRGYCDELRTAGCSNRCRLLRRSNYAMQARFSSKLGVTDYCILYVSGDADLFVHDFLPGTSKLSNRDDQGNLQGRIQAAPLSGSLKRCGHHCLPAGGMDVKHIHTEPGDALRTATDGIRDVVHLHIQENGVAAFLKLSDKVRP